MRFGRATRTEAGADDEVPLEEGETDEMLVARAQADARAFDALYLRYVSPVYRYCLLRLRVRDDAEDATSDVFLKAFAALPRYRSGTFAAWLFRIAHNVVIDVYRLNHSAQLTRSLAEPPDPAPQPCDLTARNVERQILSSALAELSKEQRIVIELGLAGWTDRQVSEILGKSVPAIKMLRYRAVRKIQGSVKERGAGEK